MITTNIPSTTHMLDTFTNSLKSNGLDTIPEESAYLNKSSRNEVLYINLSLSYELTNTEFNKINDKFKSNLSNNFEQKFINYLKFNEIDENYSCNIERTFRKYLDENKYATLDWFYDIFLKYKSDTKIILNLIKVISKYPISNSGIYIAISSLFSHPNLEVKDFAIKFFENMADENALKTLRSHEIHPQWLDDFRKNVIKDIEDSLGINP